MKSDQILLTVTGPFFGKSRFASLIICVLFVFGSDTVVFSSRHAQVRQPAIGGLRASREQPGDDVRGQLGSGSLHAVGKGPPAAGPEHQADPDAQRSPGDQQRLGGRCRPLPLPGGERGLVQDQ